MEDTHKKSQSEFTIKNIEAPDTITCGESISGYFKYSSFIE